MALLDNALDAHGGAERWQGLQRFTLHVSLGGWLVARKGKAGFLSGAVAEGSTRAQSVQITMPDRRYVYRPDRIAIEDPAGTLLAARDDPEPGFLDRAERHGWDELDFAFFAGRLLWTHVALPFLLAEPDIRLTELVPDRLQAGFPPRIATHAAEQILQFDAAGLLCRLEYRVPGSAHRLVKIAGAHQCFSGITLSTLCRWFRLDAEGRPVRKPELISLEVFDARFD